MSSKKPIETPTMSSPGSMLQRAREKAGISLQDISAQTLIPLARLDALEKEDFERVGGTAYVVGYARNAAETIGIDPQPIVQAFTSLLEAETNKRPRSEDPTQAVPDLALPKNLKKMLLAVGFALILVLIILVFLLTGDNEPSNPAPIKSQPAAEPIVSTPISPKPLASNRSLSALNEAKTSDPKEVMIEAIAETDIQALQETTAEFEEVTKPETVQTQPVPQEAPPVELEFVLNEEVEEPSQPVRQKQSLSLFFTDECWVQVTDSSGKRLAARVANSGDRLALEGLPPFDVKLGNATAALIELDGESIGINPRPGKRTLRLRIGE